MHAVHYVIAKKNDISLICYMNKFKILIK